MITIKYNVKSTEIPTKLWGYGTSADCKSFGPACPFRTGAAKKNICDVTIKIDGVLLETKDPSAVGAPMSMDPESYNYNGRGYLFDTVGEHVVTLDSPFTFTGQFYPLFYYAFADCPEITEVDINMNPYDLTGTTLKQLFAYAFYKCENLRKSTVDFYAPNILEMTQIFDSTFRACSKLLRSQMTVKCPEGVHAQGEKFLAHVYAACPELSFVKWNMTRFPSTFTKSDAAFSGCMLKVMILDTEDTVFNWDATYASCPAIPCYLLTASGTPTHLDGLNYSYSRCWHSGHMFYEYPQYFSSPFSGRVDPHVHNYYIHEDADHPVRKGGVLKYNLIHQLLRPLSMDFAKATSVKFDESAYSLNTEVYDKVRGNFEYYADPANPIRVDASELDVSWEGMPGYESMLGCWGLDHCITSFTPVDVTVRDNVKLHVGAAEPDDVPMNKGFGKTLVAAATVIPGFALANQPREVVEPIFRRMLLPETDPNYIGCSGHAPFYGCDMTWYRPGWEPLDESLPGILQYELPRFTLNIAYGAKWHDLVITNVNALLNASPAVYCGWTTTSYFPTTPCKVYSQMPVYSDGGTLYSVWSIPNIGFSKAVFSMKTWPDNHTTAMSCTCDAKVVVLPRSSEWRDRALFNLTDPNVRVDLATFSDAAVPNTFFVYHEDSHYYDVHKKYNERRTISRSVDSGENFGDVLLPAQSAFVNDSSDQGSGRTFGRAYIPYDVRLSTVSSNDLSYVESAHAGTGGSRGPSSQHGWVNVISANQTNFPSGYGSYNYRHPYISGLDTESTFPTTVRKYNPVVPDTPITLTYTPTLIGIDETPGVNPFVRDMPKRARVRLIKGDSKDNIDLATGKTIKVLDYSIDDGMLMVVPSSYRGQYLGLTMKADVPEIQWPSEGADGNYKLHLEYCHPEGGTRICTKTNPILSKAQSHIKQILVDGEPAHKNSYIEFTLKKPVAKAKCDSAGSRPFSDGICTGISVERAGTHELEFYSRNYYYNTGVDLGTGDKIRFYFEYYPGMIFGGQWNYTGFYLYFRTTDIDFTRIEIHCNAKVSSMNQMFAYFYLGNLSVEPENFIWPDLDTSEAKNWNNCFTQTFRGHACPSPRTFDIPCYDMSSATTCYEMFSACCYDALIIANLPKFDTRNVTSMERMFIEMYRYNTSVVNIQIPYLNTANVRTVTNMFNNFATNAPQVTTLTIPAFDFASAVADTSCMGSQATTITELVVPSQQTFPERTWFTDGYTNWRSTAIGTAHVNRMMSEEYYTQCALKDRFSAVQFIADLSTGSGSACDPNPDVPVDPRPLPLATDLREVFYNGDDYVSSTYWGTMKSTLDIITDSMSTATDITDLFHSTFTSCHVVRCEFPMWDFSNVTQAASAFENAFASSSLRYVTFKPWRMNGVANKDRTFLSALASCSTLSTVILPNIGSSFTASDFPVGNTTDKFISGNVRYLDTVYDCLESTAQVSGGIFRCDVNTIPNMGTRYTFDAGRVSQPLETYELTCTEVGGGYYDIQGTVTWTVLPNRKVGDPAMFFPGNTMLLEIDGKRIIWASKTVETISGIRYVTGSCFTDVALHSMNKAIQKFFAHPSGSHVKPMSYRPISTQPAAYTWRFETWNTYYWQSNQLWSTTSLASPNAAVENNIAYPYPASYDEVGYNGTSRGIGASDGRYRLPKLFNGMTIHFSQMVDATGFNKNLNLYIDGVKHSLLIPCDVVWQDDYRLCDCNYPITGIVDEASIDNLLDTVQ